MNRRRSHASSEMKYCRPPRCSMPRKQGPGEPDDRTRYVHMMEAAQEALGFAAGKSFDDLRHDRLLLRGLMNCVQEIGEAASRISDAGRARLPNLPWKKV